MDRRQKLNLLLILFSWGILSPIMSIKIHQLSIQLMEMFMKINIDPIAGLTEPLIATLGFFTSFIVRPILLKRYFSPSRRELIKLAILWSIIGLSIAVVVAFFLGKTGASTITFLILSAGVFAVGITIIRMGLEIAAGKEMIGFLAAFLVAWMTIMPPLDTLVSTRSLSFSSLPSFIQDSPLTAMVLFIVSAYIAYSLGRRYFGSVTTALGYIARAIFMVGVLHVVWIVALTFLGASSQLPRWLPIVTGAIMLAPTFVAILLRAVRGEGLFGPGGLLMSSARVGASDTLATVTQGHLKSSNKKAWIISFTGVSNEPRVLRQAEALEAAGWDVIVCGFDGHSPRPTNWTFIRLPNSEPFKSSVHSLAQMIRQRIPGLIRKNPTSLVGSALARLSHATNLWWKQIELELCRVARERPDLKADLVIAHDYYTAPAGFSVAKIYGSKFSIDVHEYAREQYSNDPAWVRDQQPIIIGVQDYYLRRADVVTVVCEGIANLIASETKLLAPPIVVRNVPFIQSMGLQKPGKSLKVLYHGDLSRPRQIHVLVESVPMWRSEFSLILRGSGDPTYIGDLKRRITLLGIEDRVKFEPPVPFKDIVKAANKADIGILSYESYSPQIRFCLPNKIFEYIQAGLALCVSDLEEIGRVVNHYKVGKLIETHNSQTIANTINAFTHENVLDFKKASLEAAKELNWDSERERLMSAYTLITQDSFRR